MLAWVCLKKLFVSCINTEKSFFYPAHSQSVLGQYPPPPLDNIPLDNIPPDDISSKTCVSKLFLLNTSVLNYPKTCGLR